MLVAPDWSVLDSLARRDLPPILWEVGNQSLAAHWLDHAVQQGCKQVTLYCPDRPAAVRAALEGGAYWSVELSLLPVSPPLGLVAEMMDRMPACDPGDASPMDGASLVRWWLALNLAWLAKRDPERVHLDTQREPQGWLGPRVTLAPGIKLVPPYWIGAGTLIESGCTIGPGALVGPGCVLSSDVHLQHALVAGGTFVGAHLDVHNKLLLGATLLDPMSGGRADLTDDFIAAAMQQQPQSTPMRERAWALLLWLPAQLLALGAGAAISREVLLPGGGTLRLSTGSRGSLLARRARWLGAVVAGRLRLVGILPRSEIAPQVPEETRTLLAHTPPGVFSLADLHGSHTPEEPDELAHALYQAALPQNDRLVRRSLLKLCLTHPAP